MMQMRANTFIERAVRCRDGVAATEFAVILPVLVVLFFGLLEASDAMTMNRRVATSVNTLADLASQSTQLDPTEASSLFTGVIEMLEPNDTSDLELRLVSVIIEDEVAVVHWSLDRYGDEPYVAGDPYIKLEDTSVVDENSSVIVAEVVYPHQPSASKLVFDEPIEFNRISVRWPRLSDRVQYCPTPETCTT